MSTLLGLNGGGQMAGGDASPRLAQFLRSRWARGRAIYQSYLDASVPYIYVRWACAAAGLFVFALRVVFLQGFYMVAYGLALLLLYLFIGFLTPFEVEGEGLALPQRNDDEYRPFIRKLPEFKFWLASMRAILFALVLTYFYFFNIPVFWPILAVYFVLLFIMTMRRQVQHMMEHHYLPFSWGKTKYTGKQGEPLRAREPEGEGSVTLASSLLPPPLTTPTRVHHGDAFSLH